MPTIATLQGMTPQGMSPAILLPNVVSLAWRHNPKTGEQQNVGGKVVQIFGVSISDVVVQGTYGRLGGIGGQYINGTFVPSRNVIPRDPLVVQQQFLNQVRQWMTSERGSYTGTAGLGFHNGQPLTFRFNSSGKGSRGLIRNYNLDVYITNFAEQGDSVTMSVGNFHPTWEMTLFIYNDNGTLTAEKNALQTQYINRLQQQFGYFPDKFSGAVTPGQFPTDVKGT